ncbi:MAG: hypothetical protein ACI977_000050 [Candidatus Nanohaloarchaea archaeon]|jgi:hypothetical protein
MLTQKKKGAGIRMVGGILLGLLTLSVVSTTVVSGGLGSSIKEGFNLIEGNVDYTVDVEETEQASAKEVISDAAKFSYQRAVSCENVQQQNQDGGYPGLAHTYLGQTPECQGASETWARPGEEIKPGESGNDMEGKYSKVNFEVTSEEPIILDESAGEVWLEKGRIAGAARGSFEDRISQSCTQSDIEDGDAGAVVGSVASGVGFYTGASLGAAVGTAVLPIGGTIVGGAVGGTVGGAIGWFAGSESFDAEYIGSGDAFTFYFQPQVGDIRAMFLEGAGSMPGDFSDSIYCSSWTDRTGESLESDAIYIDASALNTARRSMESYVVLCPGDKGYIQTNKQSPTNDGEAGENLILAKRFPYIEITSKGSCEDGNIDFNGVVPSSAAPGQDLRITGTASNYRVFDLQGAKLEGNMASSCDVKIGNPAGTVRFKKGATINAQGELPPLYSTDIYTENLNEENREFYNNIYLDGSNIESASPLLVSYRDGSIDNEMYGDLLCANPSGQFNAMWYPCTEDAETQTRINGYTYSCDSGSNSWSSTYDPKRDITDEYDSAFPNPSSENGLIDDSGIGFRFNPQNVDQEAYVTWDGEIPEGSKTITMELEFEERGHFQIDAQKGPGRETVTYINTHAQGEPPIWYFESESGSSYGSSYENQDYSETDMTYERDEIYTVTLTKNSGEIVWNIQGGGQELTKTMETNRDFTRLVFETWTPAHYPGLEKPIVQVRDIELET